jgi:hypothetical protein
MEDKVTKGGRTRSATTSTTTATSKAPAAAVKAAVKKPAATPTAAAPRKATAPRKAVTETAGAPANAGAPATAGGPDRAELVRLAAYFRAERRGFTPGYEVADWLAAELEVSAKLGAGPAATPRKAPPRKPREA